MSKINRWGLGILLLFLITATMFPTIVTMLEDWLALLGGVVGIGIACLIHEEEGRNES